MVYLTSTSRPPNILSVVASSIDGEISQPKTNVTGNGVTKIVSDEALFYINVTITVVFCGITSVAGIAANIINIIVFVRQGVFSESSTVSLLGLSVSELFSTVTMLWLCVSSGIAIADPPGLIWSPYDVMYLTAGWPHTMCSLITRSITAFIAFERCFCVVFPFKMKRTFTPRRSVIAMLCIFGYYFVSYSPVFIMIQFRRVTNSDTNETKVVLHQHPLWILVEKLVSNYLNLLTLNLLSALIVLICTTITVSRVKISSAWRKSMSAGNNSNHNHGNNNDNITTVAQPASESKPKEKKLSNSSKVANTKIDKELKLVKMIMLICVIFLICFSPNVMFQIVYGIDNEIRITGEQENLATVFFAISFLFESFNSCINIVLYYRMSSRFKKEFDILFGRNKPFN